MLGEAGIHNTHTRAARQRVFIFITERSCPKSNVILKKMRSYAFEKSSRAADDVPRGRRRGCHIMSRCCRKLHAFGSSHVTRPATLSSWRKPGPITTSRQYEARWPLQRAQQLNLATTQSCGNGSWTSARCLTALRAARRSLVHDDSFYADRFFNSKLSAVFANSCMFA
jgi:hypothetical protein